MGGLCFSAYSAIWWCRSAINTKLTTEKSSAEDEAKAAHVFMEFISQQKYSQGGPFFIGEKTSAVKIQILLKNLLDKASPLPPTGLG